jgi:hypothetical protein
MSPPAPFESASRQRRSQPERLNGLSGRRTRTATPADWSAICLYRLTFGYHGIITPIRNSGRNIQTETA